MVKLRTVLFLYHISLLDLKSALYLSNVIPLMTFELSHFKSQMISPQDQ